jgi:hypothetical protein
VTTLSQWLFNNLLLIILINMIIAIKITRKCKMQHQLPVRNIFLAALALPLQHYRKLILLGIPILITGALYTILMPTNVSFDSRGLDIATVVLLMVLMGISLLIAIVGCHRIFLMKDDDNSKLTSLYWSGNEILYFSWWIRMMLYLLLILLPLAFLVIPFMTALGEDSIGDGPIFVILMTLINVPIYYLISRWSLVLPAVATDNRKKNISWAWQISKGNAWRLTLLIGLFPFTKDLVFTLIPVTDSLVFNLVDGFLWLLVGIIEVGLLSLSYEFLNNNENHELENDSNISLDDSETV